MSEGAAQQNAARRRNEFDRSAYWAKRQHLVYYSVVERYVRYVARDAKSLLDVGGTSPYIEWFDWIPERCTLDIAEPYTSPRVRGIKADFFAWTPGRQFDVVTCLQVLEHLEDPEAACRKIREITDSAVISVPYKWDPKVTRKSAGHVQDPVDEAKLDGWMGCAPVNSTVVNEPFLPRWPRLVAWYWFGKTPVKVDMDAYRRAQQPVA